MRAFALLLSATVASSATAVDRQVVDCDEAHIGLTSLVTPVSGNSHSFYEGRVTFYTLDRIEPVCCAAGVAVVLPDAESELGDTKCLAVLDLNSVDVRNARASYGRRGLLVEMETTAYDDDDGSSVPAEPLKLRINLKNSTVTLE